MFTKIKLKNFRSFQDIEFDLTLRKNTPKRLVVIYGENGAGKSNFISAFVFLEELISTMSIRDVYEKFIGEISNLKDETERDMIQQRLLKNMRDMRAIIRDNRMIDSDGSTVVEFEFVINGRVGNYLVEFNDEELVCEKLEYLISSRRGLLFECSKEKGFFINQKLFSDKAFMNDIKSLCKKYWGKHSLLAIIVHEIEDKTKSYVDDNISKRVIEVIEEINRTSCYLGMGNARFESLGAPYYLNCEVLHNPIKGRVELEEEPQLDLMETLLTSFFTSINSDIGRAFYKRSFNDKYIDYNLELSKLISGKYRDIEFDRESSGNKQAILLFTYLLMACLGGNVVIDEADATIHDLLFKKIMEDVEPFLTGQIIMTTHNTLLMESTFAKEACYFLDETEDGHRRINSVSSNDTRTYINNNIRSRYFDNKYGGVPRVEKIDFEGLISRLEEIIPVNEN